MKVVVADDETYICSLIKHLVKWDDLGLELVGVFHNGKQVLQFAQDNDFDILICDIQMPEMDGLTLMENLKEVQPKVSVIIISGYRVFDYAVSALKNGAVNYLLKPVEEKALNDVLKSIISNKNQSETSSEDLLQKTSKRLRLFDLIQDSQAVLETEEVNRTYGYKFRTKWFNALWVNLIGVELNEDEKNTILSMFKDLVRLKLQDLCYEFEIFKDSTATLCLIVNYDLKSPELSLLTFESMLMTALMELQVKTKHQCYVSIGKEVDDISNLRQCLDNAKKAMMKRFIYPEKKVLFSDPEKPSDSDSAKFISPQEKKEFTRILETVNQAAVVPWVNKAFAYRDKAFTQNPTLIPEFWLQLQNLLFMSMANLSSSSEVKVDKLQDLQLKLTFCLTKEDIKAQAIEQIQGEIVKHLTNKLGNISAYAKGAKTYIDKNYMKDVSLKELAHHLNVNPSYLSVLFKNEMKMNYSDYLCKVRIERSKILLKDMRLNFTQIANTVGYAKVSSFNSQFLKVVGITPKEFRRIHGELTT